MVTFHSSLMMGVYYILHMVIFLYIPWICDQYLSIWMKPNRMIPLWIVPSHYILKSGWHDSTTTHETCWNTLITFIRLPLSYPPLNSREPSPPILPVKWRFLGAIKWPSGEWRWAGWRPFGLNRFPCKLGAWFQSRATFKKVKASEEPSWKVKKIKSWPEKRGNGCSSHGILTWSTS